MQDPGPSGLPEMFTRAHMHAFLHVASLKPDKGSVPKRCRRCNSVWMKPVLHSREVPISVFVLLELLPFLNYGWVSVVMSFEGCGMIA